MAVTGKKDKGLCPLTPLGAEPADPRDLEGKAGVPSFKNGGAAPPAFLP